MSRENAVYVSLLLRVTCCKMAVLYVTRETSHKRARFFVRIISNVALEHRYKKFFFIGIIVNGCFGKVSG